MMPTMPAKDRTLSKFGVNVARLRAAKGYSQEKLAEKAEIDRTYVSGIERGGLNPGIKTVMLCGKLSRDAVKETRVRAGQHHLESTASLRHMRQSSRRRCAAIVRL